jgi:hypothetical protein
VNIPGSKVYRVPNWHLASEITPASTLHAIYKASGHPLAFGIRAEFDETFAQAMIGFLDSGAHSSIDDGVVVVSCALGRFDACAFLSGKERKFLRGWAGADEKITHAFPIFSCELDSRGQLPPFSLFSRKVDVFDMRRQPEPYFEFKMAGGVSGLRVEAWSAEKYSSLQIFVNILSREEHSRLDVLNRHGQVLTFSQPTDWKDANSKIHDHLVRS